MFLDFSLRKKCSPRDEGVLFRIELRQVVDDRHRAPLFSQRGCGNLEIALSASSLDNFQGRSYFISGDLEMHQASIAK